MPRALELDPEALAEAQAAAAWYLERNETAAKRFEDELARALLEVVTMPESFPSHRLGTRRCQLRTFPYGIVFRVDESKILVSAIAHGRRRPGYWKAR